MGVSAHSTLPCTRHRMERDTSVCSSLGHLPFLNHREESVQGLLQLRMGSTNDVDPFLSSSHLPPPLSSFPHVCLHDFGIRTSKSIKVISIRHIGLSSFLLT